MQSGRTGSTAGKVTGSFDTFYHIAWGYTGAARNKSTRLQSKNIDYTLDAVEAAAKLGCKRFIGAGSQAEYGPLDREMIGPDAPEHPTTPYGVSKLAAGKLSNFMQRAWNRMDLAADLQRIWNL